MVIIMIPHQNTVCIALILAAALLSIFFMFKKETEENDEHEDINLFSIEILSNRIKTLFNDIVNQNIAELTLTKTDMKKREEQKIKLTNAIRSCAQGNFGEREYIKDYMKQLLQNDLKINSQTIDLTIPFTKPHLLTSQDKYEILLHIYKMKYKFDALYELNMVCNFEKEKRDEYGPYYEVTHEDVAKCYNKFSEPLSFVLKLEVLAQRIFQSTYGFSVADDTFYQTVVDGISGGVSGITTEQYNFMEEILRTEDMSFEYSYNSLWVIIHGKPIHFSFMGFGSRNELIRVCKNLYQYDNVGHLTSTNGYKLSYLQNGSRVVVTRPKLTSGWSFFVRKYESTKAMTINHLVTDGNSQEVIKLSEYAVKGLLNIIVSGDQNSGKTTFMKALFQYVDRRYQIRTTEQEFELWINTLYRSKNVVAFRGTEEVSMIEAINIQKKTEGVMMVLGEINDAAQANAYVTLTQAGTKCTWGTCHTITIDTLIDYFRNALLSSDGSFSSEMVAEEQVANGIDIDIHWEKTADGHRYISRITEIIPLPREDNWTGDDVKDIAEALRRMARKRAFTYRNILVLEHGIYVFKNPLSEKCVSKIIKNLSPEEGKKFLDFNAKALNKEAG